MQLNCDRILPMELDGAGTVSMNWHRDRRSRHPYPCPRRSIACALVAGPGRRPGKVKVK
ncbi:hypothetical protein OH687_26765 [Burkholderia anthina]|nr:hypothetical protein OH687_26765 [Burkholderia anthina]